MPNVDRFLPHDAYSASCGKIRSTFANVTAEIEVAPFYSSYGVKIILTVTSVRTNADGMKQ